MKISVFQDILNIEYQAMALISSFWIVTLNAVKGLKPDKRDSSLRSE